MDRFHTYVLYKRTGIQTKDTLDYNRKVFVVYYILWHFGGSSEQQFST